MSGIRKNCSRCGETKHSIKDFYKRSQSAGGGREAVCKKCRQSQDKREPKWRHIKQRYGLDKQSYLELLNSQDCKCGICLVSLEDTREKTLCLDHCHTTGEIRGFLCNKCNTALGLFKDNVKFLQNAINYLNRGLE